MKQNQDKYICPGFVSNILKNEEHDSWYVTANKEISVLPTYFVSMKNKDDVHSSSGGDEIGSCVSKCAHQVVCCLLTD